MKKRGRPRIEIDKKTFEGLCTIQCTLEEIAGFFKCSEDTIENWCKREYDTIFSDIYKTLSSGGKISLRRSQFKMAKSNPTMAIWLGKQYLGQKEQTDVQMSIKDDESIKEMNEYFKQKRNP